MRGLGTVTRLVVLLASAVQPRPCYAKASATSKCLNTLHVVSAIRDIVRSIPVAAELAHVFSTSCSNSPLLGNITSIVDQLVQESGNDVQAWRIARPVQRAKEALGAFVAMPQCNGTRVGLGGEQSKMLCRPALMPSESGCLFISVGSNGDAAFEKQMHALAPACSIQTWDGTLVGRRKHLSAQLPNFTTFVPHNFGPESWRQINASSVSVLKIDCEGCELTALVPWVRNICTDRILVEVHVVNATKTAVTLEDLRAEGYELGYGENNPLCGPWTALRCVELSYARREPCSRQVGLEDRDISWRASQPQRRLSTSADVVKPPVPHRRAELVAVVQHSHTAAARPILLRARQQLDRWRGSPASRVLDLSHFVVFWADEPSGCPALKSSLPFDENVSCVSSRAMGSHFPGFDSIWAMAGQGRHTETLRKGRYNKQFAYNNCDGPMLSWARSAGTAYDFAWFLEWDLAWSGDLAQMVASYHGSSYTVSGLVQPPPDLLCDRLGAGHMGIVVPHSPHHMKRNRTHFPFPTLRTCLPGAIRVSARLLLRVMRWTMLESGSYIYCEMRAATMCNTPQPPGKGIDEYWENCSWADLRKSDGHRGLFSTSTYSYTANVPQNIPPKVLFNDSNAPQFYHRYKWT